MINGTGLLLMGDLHLQVLDQVADEKSLIIAVGYMLRSSAAVVAAKRLMQEVGLQFICCIHAHIICLAFHGSQE